MSPKMQKAIQILVFPEPAHKWSFFNFYYVFIFIMYYMDRMQPNNTVVLCTIKTIRYIVLSVTIESPSKH